MINKFLYNYLQQSLIYDNFFTESINAKIDTINNIKKTLNNVKGDKDLLTKIKSGTYTKTILNDKTIGNIHVEIQKLIQESDSLPIIINGAIMTSFQLLETLFFNIFKHYINKDYMYGDIKKWFEQIEKGNTLFNGKDNLSKVIGQDILDLLLEYNKRRDLCTHSFGRITSKYLKFLEDHNQIKNKIEQINKLGSMPFIQKYEQGEYLYTSQEYYSINQMLLDLVACKVCLYLIKLEKGDINNSIEDIISVILTNKKYVLCSSLLIGIKSIKGFSLNIDSEIDLLFACDRINRGGFQKEKEKIELICRDKIHLMNKGQLFKRYLIKNDIVNVIKNIPEDGNELVNLMNNPITTFYFKDKKIITAFKDSDKGNFFKEHISDNEYKKLSINGINNLKYIVV